MSVEYTDAQLELFNQAMGIMKKELPSASYMTFFKPLKLRAVTPDALIHRRSGRFYAEKHPQPLYDHAL